MLREIVLDTETTGFEPGEGHRIVEIGCIELADRFPTGRTFHAYLNPDRDMPEDAFRVHGLSSAFLADKPRFAEVHREFVDFLGDAKLVIHNAAFDTKFLNFELGLVGLVPLAPERIIDTLSLARRKHPNASNSLDALCDRYGLDRSRRVKHGALLDAEILAEVYSELLGGKQSKLDLRSGAARLIGRQTGEIRVRKVALQPRLTEAERAAHAAFVETLGPEAIWRIYQAETALVA